MRRPKRTGLRSCALCICFFEVFFVVPFFPLSTMQRFVSPVQFKANHFHGAFSSFVAVRDVKPTAVAQRPPRTRVSTSTLQYFTSCLCAITESSFSFITSRRHRKCHHLRLCGLMSTYSGVSHCHALLCRFCHVTATSIEW